MKKVILFYSLLVLFAKQGYAQQTTINQKNADNRDVVSSHKVLLIPFEPKLYMGEIDYNINLETKLTSKEIKYKFRDGLNEQLYKAFKQSKYNALDLMDDTLKYKKDIENIYQYLSYDFQLIPNQDNYQTPKKEKKENTIEKGQINVETNSDNRFMNAKLTNTKILSSLNSKFKTDVFVFINQLDIRASGAKNPGELGNGNPNRKIVVHYTVFNLNFKEINSGVAEQDFESTLNNPKKIIDKYFSKVASTIVLRVNKSLATKPN